MLMYCYMDQKSLKLKTRIKQKYKDRGCGTLCNVISVQPVTTFYHPVIYRM